MFENAPRQKLFSLIQSTAASYHDIYKFALISSVSSGATAIWGPVIPNGTGGNVNFYIQIATSYASAYALDLSIYKSFDKTNWFLHSGLSHPNITSTGRSWSYHDANLDNLYHRIQYTFRSKRKGGVSTAGRINVRGFSEIVDKL